MRAPREPTSVLSDRFIRALTGLSFRVARSGFFSVQVLDRCIQIWNLSLARWRSEEFADSWDKPESVELTSLTRDPTDHLISPLAAHREEEAFILNLSSHWFCLRRFGRSSSRW